MHPYIIRGAIILALGALTWLGLTSSKNRPSGKNATSDKGATVEPKPEANSSNGPGGGDNNSPSTVATTATVEPPTATEGTPAP